MSEKLESGEELLCRCRERMGRLSGVSFAGSLYRFCDPSYAARNSVLSGENSRTCGGPYNYPGCFPAAYFSTSSEGALAEYLADWKRYGLDPRERACVLVFVEALFSKLLDLTDPAVLENLCLGEAGPSEESWHLVNASGRATCAQVVGRAARERSFEGLIVPSPAGSQAHGLVLFPGNFMDPSRLYIVGEELLPY